MCDATIPLESYSGTKCALPDGHEGEHETDAWGPTITWSNAADVRSAA